MDEARGVARGLPLFMRDFYKLDPCFFCSSESVSEALEETWVGKTRTFLTKDKTDEMIKLDNLDNLNAIKKQYVSKDHQKLMALEGDEEVSLDIRLTKGNVPPSATPSPDNIDISALTWETRESKAKDYSAEEGKKVAAQYVEIITTLNSKLASNDNKLVAMEKKLELAISALEMATKTAEIRNNEDAKSNISSLLSIDSTLEGAEFLGTTNGQALEPKC